MTLFSSGLLLFRYFQRSLPLALLLQRSKAVSDIASWRGPRGLRQVLVSQPAPKALAFLLFFRSCVPPNSIHSRDSPALYNKFAMERHHYLFADSARHKRRFLFQQNFYTTETPLWPARRLSHLQLQIKTLAGPLPDPCGGAHPFSFAPRSDHSPTIL